MCISFKETRALIDERMENLKKTINDFAAYQKEKKTNNYLLIVACH